MITEFIEKIPKAELLVHLEGCLEPELLLAFAQRNQINLPYANLKEIQKAYSFSNLTTFLHTYYEGVKVLVTEQDFYELTSSYLKKASAQNVRHAEISFDPQAHLSRGISFETFMRGIHKAIDDAKKLTGISAHLIMCLRRDIGADDAQQVLLKALEFKEWIIAVGLDSAEKNNPPGKFKEIFARAREYGFFTVAAAGEEGPAEYIWQAIDVLGVARIGYGVHCLDDEDLMSRLALKKIPISVCPISNVKLGLVKNMAQHPIKRMYQQDLCVTINSDNPAYFGGYINENFATIATALKFDKTIVFEIARNAFLASFLDSDEKEKYLAELENTLKK